MLAQARRRSTHRPSHAGCLEGRAGRENRGGAGVARGQRNEEFPRFQMLIGVKIAGFADRRRGDAPALHQGDQVHHFLRPGPLFDQRRDRIDVLAAHGAVLEDFLPGPFGITHQLYQALPLRLFNADDLHHPVGALMHAQRSAHREAQPRGLQVAVCPPDQAQVEHRGHAFLLGNLDRLPHAGLIAIPKRAQRRHRGVNPGLKLGLRAEIFQRRQVGALAQHRIENRASAGVNRVELVSLVMAARAPIAVARDARDDQPRMARGKQPAFHRTRRALRRGDVMNQDIGVRRKLVEDRALARRPSDRA